MNSRHIFKIQVPSNSSKQRKPSSKGKKITSTCYEKITFTNQTNDATQRTCPSHKRFDNKKESYSHSTTSHHPSINHHSFSMQAFAIRHAFKDDLPPNTDREFFRFLFQHLAKNQHDWSNDRWCNRPTTYWF